MSNHAWRVGAARAHILGWASYVDPTFTRPAHVKLLGERLMKVERGEIRRLIVMMPPRHGKSELATVKFPAFYLGRHPDKRVIVACHTANLALRFSMRSRNDFAAFAPEIWGIGVDPNVSAMQRWDVQDSSRMLAGPPGGMIAAGVGGPITGEGADLAIIDDPIKDAEAANSQLQRDTQWDWYRYVLRTRLFPGAAVVLVLTHWHEDDVAGRLLQAAESDPAADQWEVLKLPALAEESDPLGRVEGAALWPEQYSVESLLETKASVGTYVWNALYQQRPAPPEGGLFRREWWRYYRQPPQDFDALIESWDMTFKDTVGTDFVVGQVWALKGADKYLLDQVRGRMSFTATISAIKSLTAKWYKHMGAKLVEDSANGPAIIDTLKHEIAGLIAVRPQGGKEARASAVSPQVEAGNIYLPEQAPWVHDFIEECATFPKGAHDDQVDAMSQALLRLEEMCARRRRVLKAPLPISTQASRWVIR